MPAPSRPARTAVAALALAAAAGACSMPPEPVVADPALPPAERELDFLLRSLEALHPDPFGRAGEDEFRAACAAAAERYDPRDPGAWHLELRRLVAMVADSHTRVESLGPFERTAAPFLLDRFRDGWWIVGAFQGHQGLVGSRVLTMDGKPMDEILEALRPYVSYENEAAFREFAPGFLRRPAFLHAAGILSSRDSVVLGLADLDGAERTVRVPARRGSRSYSVFRLAAEEPDPWFSRHPDRVYWLAFPAHGVLYVRYSACREDPALPMREFAAAVERALREQEPRRAIVDLRGNGGGDSTVLAPVIRLFEPGGPGARAELVALTDAGTFSSGLLNAWQLRERAGAILAGEPSAQRPNCFGEIVTITLPVSGTKLSCSTKTFRIVPGDPEQLPVDVEIPMTGADWFRGRDPALQRFLNGEE